MALELIVEGREGKRRKKFRKMTEKDARLFCVIPDTVTLKIEVVVKLIEIRSPTIETPFTSDD